MNGTFTNTEPTARNKVDIEELNKMYAGWQKDFVARFDGMFVKVDDALVGNQYYIAVSQKVYEQILNPISPVEA